MCNFCMLISVGKNLVGGDSLTWSLHGPTEYFGQAYILLMLITVSSALELDMTIWDGTSWHAKLANRIPDSLRVRLTRATFTAIVWCDILAHACTLLALRTVCFQHRKDTGAYSYRPPLSVTKNVIHAYPRLTSWCSYLAAGYSEDTLLLTFCLRRKSNASWILPSPSNISDPRIDFLLLYGIFSPETVSKSWRRSFPSLRSVYRSSMWRWCTFCKV